MNIIEKAREFAIEKHKGQKDDEGFDYFYAHCDVVYNILTEITTEENLLASALLHDTIEDTQTTYEELVKEFNQEVADLVNEVTHEGKKDEKGYYFPRLKSKKGILLKFADRMSNLNRMEGWDDKRQEHYLKRSRFWNKE